LTLLHEAITSSRRRYRYTNFYQSCDTTRSPTQRTEATRSLVIAALLHDAIEDQEVPCDIIAREFGKEVAELVGELSDDKTLEKSHRKRLQVETAHTKSHGAKLIKLADKTSNLRAIAFSPPPTWSVKRRLEYIHWAREVAQGLRGTSPLLEEKFDRAAEEAERSVHVPAGST